MTSRKNWSEMVRSATFGVQDSLVSTVGMISGVAAGGLDSKAIILSGLVLILVEAVSMGFGELFSAETAIESKSHKEADIISVIPAALLMLFSYFLAGLIPIFPYIVWTKNFAFWLSNLLSISGLYCYGYFYGKSVNLGGVKHGIKMAIYGSVAILLGVLAGGFLSQIG